MEMNAFYAGLFLATGILLGALSTAYGIGPRSGRKWMTIELVLLSIVGSLILHNVAAQLPGGWFALVYTGVAFAVIVQAPKGYFISMQGSDVLGLIAIIPPFIFVVCMIAWGAWYLALTAASLFFVVPITPDDFQFFAETWLLTLTFSVSVIASIRGRIIYVR